VKKQFNSELCPFCQSGPFVMIDEERGQCFNQRCGLRWIELDDPAAQVFEDIYRRCHQHMLAQPVDAVFAHSMVGAVPEDLNVEDLWAPKVTEARRCLDELSEARGRGRPTKAQEKAIAGAKLSLERLQTLAKESDEVVKGATGARVWFWTDSSHQIVKLTVTLPNGEERSMGAGGLFNHGLFAPGAPARGTEALRGQLLVVTRPEDVLAVQALGARRAQEEDLPPERGYLWCAAIGSSRGAKDVRGLTRKPILLMPDTVAESQLISAVRALANLHVFHPPVAEGVAEWLTGPLGGWDALVDRFYKRQLRTRPFDRVRSEIDQIREMEAVPKFEVDRWSAEAITRDITERGKLYFDGQLAYVFLHDTREVIPIDIHDDGWRQLANRYGVAPTDTIAEAVAVSITMHAREHGTRAEVYPFVHYDGERNTVYLFNLDKTVYRITGEQVEAKENGVDGKLFVRNPKWQPFELRLDVHESQLPSVMDRLVGTIRLAEGQLHSREVMHLIQLQLLAMFFPELFPTRPILAMIGPKGSGKTSSLELTGTLFFGANFKVADLTEDPRDFDAALTSEFFVVADNADRTIKWLPDKLAVVATGGTIKRRLYYTTNKQVEFPLKAWLAITSRTPQFNREDVADRLLPICVERFKGYAALGDLKSDVVRDRNRLLTALVRDVQKALRGLRTHRGVRHETSFRMADYGQFAHKVSSAIGFDGDIEDVLRRLAAEQVAFAMRNEPLFEFLDRWLALPGNRGRELTTGELYADLMRNISDEYMGMPWKGPQAFGRVLEDHWATLETVYGVTSRQGRSGTKIIRFPASNGAEMLSARKDGEKAA
jgi:hypothetical protein